jgi:hypothetical protein
MAFRDALEARINSPNARKTMAVGRRRKLIAIERFLVRLQTDKSNPWLLKGAFALDLRASSGFRTSKDLDLGLDLSRKSAASASMVELLEEMREHLDSDPGDYFEFLVSEPQSSSLRIARVQAYRFPVNSRLGGRTFDQFHVDVGVGDPLVFPAEKVSGTDFLGFAGIKRPLFRATSTAQHLAEKIHAITLPPRDPPNSRSHDLADAIWLLDQGIPEKKAKTALREIFKARDTHAIPAEIPEPPAGWNATYPFAADELPIEEKSCQAAVDRLRNEWTKLKP